MLLHKLTLTNFRSYKLKEFVFDKKFNLILGPNAAGKTNLMEAIFLLSTGNSFHATRESEMISYGEEIARITGEGETVLEIILTNGQVQASFAAKKIYKVNGVNKRKSDFVGNLKVVLFRPEDIDLILGSPSLRRNYLDNVLSPIDREYFRSLLSYKKALSQRNKLLDKIRDGEAQRSQLLFWDRLLIKEGGVLTDKREEYIDFLNQKLQELKIIYDKSLISEKRLKQYQEAETALGATLVGPHRDDIKFQDSRNLQLFGSRGEQRMAVLAIKFLELSFVREKTGERPILLLDDIFSELDSEHQKKVIKIIPYQQTILTATDPLVEKFFHDKIRIINLK